LYLIGFLTRIISGVLLVFILVLFGLHESLNKLGYWSHGLVIMPITHLAFIFAPAGKISLDYFIHSKIKSFQSFFNQDKNYFFYTVFPLVIHFYYLLEVKFVKTKIITEGTTVKFLDIGLTKIYGFK
jgi:hypothetical protein